MKTKIQKLSEAIAKKRLDENEDDTDNATGWIDRSEFVEYMTEIPASEFRKLNKNSQVKLAQFCLNFYAIKNPKTVTKMAEKLGLSSFQADMA